MRYIAERYIKELEKPAAKPPTWAEIKAFFVEVKAFFIKHRQALGLGLMSIGLYSLLYLFNADLTHIAQESHAGHKRLFFVPIIIALLFSGVHGTFTSRFWDMLGIKAKH